MEQNGTDENGSQGIVDTPVSKKRKCRAWCFTKNNATLEDVVKFKEVLEQYEYVFKMERGRENGMIHLQGVMRYKNPRYNWPQLDAHWERCKRWPNSVKYCTKVHPRS